MTTTNTPTNTYNTTNTSTTTNTTIDTSGSVTMTTARLYDGTWVEMPASYDVGYVTSEDVESDSSITELCCEGPFCDTCGACLGCRSSGCGGCDDCA